MIPIKLNSGLFLKIALVILVGFVIYQSFMVDNLHSVIRKRHSQSKHLKKQVSTNDVETKTETDYDDADEEEPNHLARPNVSPKHKVAVGSPDEATNILAMQKLVTIPEIAKEAKEEMRRKLYSKSSLRICILTYVPHKDNHYYINQFLTLLYSSWRYVVDHPELALKADLKGQKKLDSLVVVDMIVYCAREACKRMHITCTEYHKEHMPKRGSDEFQKPRCIFVPSEEHAQAKEYGWVNSFIFAQDQSFADLQSSYDWATRLDTDCLITPPFLTWAPDPSQEVAMEQAHYCTDFNKKRLEYIAEKLKLNNQKVHCIGSSWYIRPNKMADAAAWTVNLTMHIASQEFNRTLPGLEEIFKDNTNPEGIWPTWWRGVSLLYGTELALNHVVNSSLANGWVKGLLDQGTCGHAKIMNVLQLHCYQGDCQFRKFDFMDSIISVANTRSLDPRLFLFYRDRDASEMNTREYTTFIAWYGAGHYLKHIKSWTASALGIETPECKDYC